MWSIEEYVKDVVQTLSKEESSKNLEKQTEHAHCQVSLL